MIWYDGYHKRKRDKGGKPGEDGGSDWSKAAARPGMLRIAGHPPGARKGSLEVSESV